MYCLDTNSQKRDNENSHELVPGVNQCMFIKDRSICPRQCSYPSKFTNKLYNLNYIWNDQ